MNYKLYPTKLETAKALAEELYTLVSSLKKEKITLAISGGSTPFILFDIWANDYSDKIDWQKLHFFWVDERCVLPDDMESNFGRTKKTLFDRISIPAANIHRVRGEENPQKEEERYSQEIELFVDRNEGVPQFDIILLGMGDDGHTASIFPSQLELMSSSKIVSVAQNPYSGQNRITLTGKVINNAKNIYFLVTGKDKAEKVKAIFNNEAGYLRFPAAYIHPISGKLVWYFDEEAGYFDFAQ